MFLGAKRGRCSYEVKAKRLRENQLHWRSEDRAVASSTSGGDPGPTSGDLGLTSGDPGRTFGDPDTAVITRLFDSSSAVPIDLSTYHSGKQPPTTKQALHSESTANSETSTTTNTTESSTRLEPSTTVQSTPVHNHSASMHVSGLLSSVTLQGTAPDQTQDHCTLKSLETDPGVSEVQAPVPVNFCISSTIENDVETDTTDIVIAPDPGASLPDAGLEPVTQTPLICQGTEPDLTIEAPDSTVTTEPEVVEPEENMADVVRRLVEVYRKYDGVTEETIAEKEQAENKFLVS